jgi:hypothetical protein
MQKETGVRVCRDLHSSTQAVNEGNFSQPSMDSTTSDTEDSNYAGELTSMLFAAAAETKVAACDTNAGDDSNADEAAAAGRQNDTNNSHKKEMIATGAETSQGLDLMTKVCEIESATGGIISAPAAAPSRDSLTLAQLYHQSRRMRRIGRDSTSPRSKCPPTPTPPPGNGVVDTSAEMICAPAIASHDTLTQGHLHHPNGRTRKYVKSLIKLQDRDDCSSLSCSITASDAAEQIWQEIKNDICNTEEDDWSFNDSPPLNSNSPKLSLGAMIPGAIAFSERVNEDVTERERKRTKKSHNK